MAFFAWNDSYSVGVRRFDSEHQQLFAIMNELYEGMKSGRGKEVMGTTLKKLIRYTEQHFSSEEAVMSQAGYAELSSQVDQHRQFTQKMKDLEGQFHAGAAGLSVGLLDYLRDWLTTHISIADKRYTAFLNAKGIS